MDQSNISQKNIARLEGFASIDDVEFQKLRMLILEIAQLAPRRRGRWKRLAENRPDLLSDAMEADLIEDSFERRKSGHPFEDALMNGLEYDDFFDRFSLTADTECSENELPGSEIPF